MNELVEKHLRPCRKIVNRRSFIQIIICMITVLFVMLMISGCVKSEEHTGMAQIPSTSSEMKGSNYQDVFSSFINFGFVNVKLESIEDLITEEHTKDGEVEEVTVGGKTDYQISEWISADTEVIIKYHTFQSKETSSSDESINSQESGNEFSEGESTDRTSENSFENAPTENQVEKSSEADLEEMKVLTPESSE